MEYFSDMELGKKVRVFEELPENIHKETTAKSGKNTKTVQFGNDKREQEWLKENKEAYR